MDYSLNQHTNEVLMTIGKYCGIILISLNISCTNMNNDYFQVFGNKELLGKCKINLVKIDEAANE